MTRRLAKFARIKLFGLAGLAALLLAADGLAHEETESVPAAPTPAAQATGPTESHEPGAPDGGPGGGHVSMPPGPHLMMPIMNSARGRKAFASKACVTCHAINGVGGHDAPNLDAHSMQPYMNPFDFAAKMWRGAAVMIAVQEEALGYQIEFTGQELANIIAFVHDDAEQHKFTEADIPSEIMAFMGHEHAKTGGAMAHRQELGHNGGGGHHDDGHGAVGHHKN